jgi:hypothetical protein
MFGIQRNNRGGHLVLDMVNRPLTRVNNFMVTFCSFYLINNNDFDNLIYRLNCMSIWMDRYDTKQCMKLQSESCYRLQCNFVYFYVKILYFIVFVFFRRKNLSLPGRGSFEELVDYLVVKKPSDLCAFLSRFDIVLGVLK